MRIHSSLLLLAMAALAPGQAARADGNGASLDEKVAAVVRQGQPTLEALAANRDVVADVLARDRSTLTGDQAKALQARWVAPGPPTADLKPYLENRSAAAFRAASKKTPTLAKVFSLDKAGNVAATAPKCHDFVHGYEPKFLDCYQSGQTKVNKPALDLTSKTYAVQISVPIKDAQGATAGVLVGTFSLK
ncbi:MAG TPA: PDC sensor domain-containing protein [bacterium]|nr:PDC sensor domain-containing protein [bacterium]